MIGGHLKPDVYNLASNVAEKHGVRAGAEIAEFEMANLEAVREYVRSTGAECDFTVTQAVDVQLSEQHNKSLKARYDKFINDGAEIAKAAFYIDGKDAEMVSGVKGAKGAYKYAAGHVWPYKMIHHMFTNALAHDNVSIQTNTPVTSISSTPDSRGRWTVTTSRGTVSARQVVMATNAYTAALLPEYRDKIIPYRGICSHIVTPGPAKPPLLANTYALRFNSWDFDYLIPRNDGSIIVGGARRTYLPHLEDWYGNVDDTQLIDRAKGYFDGYMQRHFRGWEDSGAYTDRVWTGSELIPLLFKRPLLLWLHSGTPYANRHRSFEVMGYSADQLPRIGHVPGRKNMFIMGGFTGHGMPQIFLGAKGLSRMILEDLPFSKTGVPRLFEETSARLQKPDNFALDLHKHITSPKGKL